MSITPTVLLAGSGLLSNQALAINADYKADIIQLANTDVTNVFNQLHEMRSVVLPGNEQDEINATYEQYPTLIHAGSYSLYEAAGQLKLAHTNFGGGSPTTKHFLAVYNNFYSLCMSLDEIYIGLKHFENLKWEDIDLNIQSHSDTVNAGVLRALLVGTEGIDSIAYAKQQLRTGESLSDVAGRRLAVLSRGLRNLGTLFTADDLPNLGKASTLIASMYTNGLSRLGGLHDLVLELGVTSLDEVRERYLVQILEKVTGNALTEIIEATGVVLHTPKNVTTLADLLDVKNLFDSATLRELPMGTFNSLATVLSKVSGKYQTIEELANMLDSIDVSDIEGLEAEVTPLPSADINEYYTANGTGSGLAANPTLHDFMWWLSGQNGYVKVVDTFRQFQIECANDATISAALTTYAGLRNKVNLEALFNAILDNSVTKFWLKECDRVYAKFIEQFGITVDLIQLHTGLSLSAYASGVSEESNASLASIINNLHTVGRDTNNLGTRDYFMSLCRTTREGRAVKAAVLEGRSQAQQMQSGIAPVTVVDTFTKRQENAEAELESAIAEMKQRHAQYTNMLAKLDRNENVPQVMQNHIVISRQTAIDRVTELATLAKKNVNPYRELY